MVFAKALKVIILDFDGVIIESNHIKDDVFREIFARYPEQAGKAMAYHREHISVSRYEKFDFLLQAIGQPDNTQLKEEWLHDFSTMTLEKMKSVDFVKGAKDFLQSMQGVLPLYLASVTPIDDLEKILDHLSLRGYFKDVYGCPPWKKPGAVKDILTKENIQPQQALLVGDSYGDQRAAKENNIHFIARDSGLDFEDPQPTCIIKDLTELPALLN